MEPGNSREKTLLRYLESIDERGMDERRKERAIRLVFRMMARIRHARLIAEVAMEECSLKTAMMFKDEVRIIMRKRTRIGDGHMPRAKIKDINIDMATEAVVGYIREHRDMLVERVPVAFDVSRRDVETVVFEKWSKVDLSVKVKSLLLMAVRDASLRDAGHTTGLSHSSPWRYSRKTALIAVVAYVLATIMEPRYLMIDGTGHDGKKYTFIVSVHGSVISVRGMKGEPFIDGLGSVDGFRLLYGDRAYGRKSVRRKVERMGGFLITPKRMGEGVEGLYRWILRRYKRKALDMMRYEVRGRIEKVIGDIKDGMRGRKGLNWMIFEALRMNYSVYIGWVEGDRWIGRMERRMEVVWRRIVRWREMMIRGE